MVGPEIVDRGEKRSHTFKALGVAEKTMHHKGVLERGERRGENTRNELRSFNTILILNFEDHEGRFGENCIKFTLPNSGVVVCGKKYTTT